MQTNLSEIVAM